MNITKYRLHKIINSTNNQTKKKFKNDKKYNYSKNFNHWHTLRRKKQFNLRNVSLKKY